MLLQLAVLLLLLFVEVAGYRYVEIWLYGLRHVMYVGLFAASAGSWWWLCYKHYAQHNS